MKGAENKMEKRHGEFIVTWLQFFKTFPRTMRICKEGKRDFSKKS